MADQGAIQYWREQIAQGAQPPTGNAGAMAAYNAAKSSPLDQGGISTAAAQGKMSPPPPPSAPSPAAAQSPWLSILSQLGVSPDALKNFQAPQKPQMNYDPYQSGSYGTDGGLSLNGAADKWTKGQQGGNNAASQSYDSLKSMAEQTGRSVQDIVDEANQAGKYSPSTASIADQWGGVQGIAGDIQNNSYVQDAINDPKKAYTTYQTAVLGGPAVSAYTHLGSQDKGNIAHALPYTQPMTGIPGAMYKGVTGKDPYSPITGGDGINTITDIAGGGSGAAGNNGGSGRGSNTGIDTGGTPYLGDYNGIGQGNPYTTFSAQNIQYSPWKDLALNKQGAEQTQLLDQATKSAGTSNAMAMDSLAGHGGLRAGSAERIAMGNADNLATQQQGILGQGVINRANIGMQGAQMDTDVNKYNAGANTASQAANVQAQIGDVGNRNAWDQNKYAEAMKLKGAGMTANAIGNSGKK